MRGRRGCRVPSASRCGTGSADRSPVGSDADSQVGVSEADAGSHRDLHEADFRVLLEGVPECLGAVRVIEALEMAVAQAFSTIVSSYLSSSVVSVRKSHGEDVVDASGSAVVKSARPVTVRRFASALAACLLSDVLGRPWQRPRQVRNRAARRRALL